MLLNIKSDSDISDFIEEYYSSAINLKDNLKKFIENSVGIGKNNNLYNDIIRGGLNIKFGIDPTSSDVHIGHTVPMRLLNILEKLGNRITIIIGTFTASVGDPSGSTSERPSLTGEEITDNKKNYISYFKKYISPNIKLEENDSWLNKISIKSLLRLLERVQISTLIQRDDFKNRINNNIPLTVSEILYSILMAYDSYAINASIEVGGIDQLLNMHMGRYIMELHNLKPQGIITVPLLLGLYGKDKMSKSKSNYISLNDSPINVFGKTMSINDSLLYDYYRLCTYITEEDVDHLFQYNNPFYLKKLLASIITADIHSIKDALNALKEFTVRYSNNDLLNSTSIKTYRYFDISNILLIEFMKEVLNISRSDIRRIQKQNGLRIVDKYKNTLYMFKEVDLYETCNEILYQYRSDQLFIALGKKIIKIINS